MAIYVDGNESRKKYQLSRGLCRLFNCKRCVYNKNLSCYPVLFLEDLTVYPSTDSCKTTEFCPLAASRSFPYLKFSVYNISS